MKRINVYRPLVSTRIVLGFLGAVCLVCVVAPARAQSSTKASLLAPFRVGGNDGLSSLVLIPAMDTAVTQGKGHWRIVGTTELIENGFDHTSGASRFEMNGATFETHALLGYGVTDNLDLSLDVPFTAYGSRLGAVNTGQSLFPGAEAGTNFNLVEADREMSDPILESKLMLWGGERENTAVALRASLKLPLADERDLHSTGAFDIAAALLGSLDLDWGVWHATLGYTYVGSDDAFRPEANVDLADVISFGVAYTFEVIEDKLAVGVQFFGFLNPYRDVSGSVEGLDGPPFGTLVGARWFPHRNLALEVAIGPGLTSDAADLTAHLGIAYQR